MKEINVKITELKPSKMISIYAYGKQPEDLAWGKLCSWVEKSNFKIDPDKNKIYGFNNPCPSAGSTNYGYEFWISINSEIHPEDDIRIIDFAGGLYASTQIIIQTGEEIPEYWRALKIWCEKSKYSFASHQWLEEHTVDGQPIAIFMPIKE